MPRSNSAMTNANRRPFWLGHIRAACSQSRLRLLSGGPQLEALCEIYFRVLKDAASGHGASGAPLLEPALQGLARLLHLIDFEASAAVACFHSARHGSCLLLRCAASLRRRALPERAGNTPACCTFLLRLRSPQSAVAACDRWALRRTRAHCCLRSRE